MIARTTAVIEPGGVLGELACAPPLTLRQVHGEGRCELRLVGTAAGPLAGDDLSICLQLRAGARATLRATGASVAQGRGQAGARRRCRSARTWPKEPTWSPTRARWSSARAAGWMSAST